MPWLFEPTAPHVTYLVLPGFLILFALFSKFIRNRLHLSEPPLAVLVGIIFGPYLLDVLSPREWGMNDRIMQEVTRVVVSIQCFATGIELPKHYFHRHWKSVAIMLGPVMTFSWAIAALFAYWIFQISVPAALIIGACLSPTDPILAASILHESQFSGRVPKRLKHLLSAESACNDGVSFPFLYIGIVIFTQSSTGESIKHWFIDTIIWQCILGLLVGLVLGTASNKILRFVERNDYIGRPSFVVFYLLLAILSVGVGSTLGSDDFLVAFGSGIGFAHDGWFSSKTRETKFPVIVDLILNSAMFVYFGAMIPWKDFIPTDLTPHIGLWQLFVFLVLIVLFRRIPIVLAVKPFTPDLLTYREALFCGHFGPMGVGALFLAIESIAQIETGDSIPLPRPPHFKPPYSDKAVAIKAVWPIVCFVVLGSTMIHGLSVAVISVGGHFSRKSGERAPLIAAETDGLGGMIHEGGGGESASEISGDEDDEEEGS